MKLTAISLVAVIIAIVLTSDLGKAENVQNYFSDEQLDEILEQGDIDYRKEIKEHVFKPCLQYYAKRQDVFYRRAFKDVDLPESHFKELVTSSTALEAFRLRKSERTIYDAVKNEKEDVRKLSYGLFLAKCKEMINNESG